MAQPNLRPRSRARSRSTAAATTRSERRTACRCGDEACNCSDEELDAELPRVDDHHAEARVCSSPRRAARSSRAAWCRAKEPNMCALVIYTSDLPVYVMAVPYDILACSSSSRRGGSTPPASTTSSWRSTPRSTSSRTTSRATRPRTTSTSRTSATTTARRSPASLRARAESRRAPRRLLLRGGAGAPTTEAP